MSIAAIFDKQHIRANLLRAAVSGQAVDFLNLHAAAEVLERAQSVKRSFKTALVTGGVHGSTLTSALSAAFADIDVVSMPPTVDLSRGCGSLRVVAGEDMLPIRDGALDLIASILSLHLVDDLPGTLIQLRRVLRPDGLFLAALLGGDTLIELRQAFMIAESETTGGVSPRVFPTANVRDLGGLLQRAGFALPVADVEQLTVTYSDPMALMLELKAMGAANPLAARSRTFLRRDTLARAIEIYNERFSMERGRVRATFEIIYLSGWAPHKSQQKPLKPGSAAARLADALSGIETAATDEATSFPGTSC